MISIAFRALKGCPPLSHMRTLSTINSRGDDKVESLLEQLRLLDTASLCDADKAHKNQGDTSPMYDGLRLLGGLESRSQSIGTTAGHARTVQLSQPDDLLAVIQGLSDACSDEILVVNTLNSTKAVAGELFCAEAARRGMVGIVIDGPMRDTAYLTQFLSVACYSKSVTPYSGTTQSPGEVQVDIECGGVDVHPGDVVVGDRDGIVVGSEETFFQIVQIARDMQATERIIKERLVNGDALHSLTNFEEHLAARSAERPSALEFRLD